MKYQLKYVLFYVLSFLIYSCSFTKNVDRLDQSLIHFKKKVNYPVDFESEIIADKLALTTKNFELETYDRKGNLLSSVKFDKNGNPDLGTFYEFNKYGDITKKVFSSSLSTIDENDTLCYIGLADFFITYTYEYDFSGKVLSRITTRMNKLDFIDPEFKYKSATLLKESLETTSKYKHSPTKEIYFYNQNNNIDSILIFVKHSTTKRVRYSYDQFNRIQQISTLGDFIGLETFKYYDNGSKKEYLKKTFAKSGNELNYKTFERYDQNENITYLLVEHKGVIMEEVLSVYNDDNLLIKEFRNSELPGTLVDRTYKYRLNRIDNIRTKLRFSDGIISFVFLEEYKYY
jgi:hypothetical protein